MSSPRSIEEITTRAAPLDMASGQFRSLGHDLVDRIADFLSSIRTSLHLLIANYLLTPAPALILL